MPHRSTEDQALLEIDELDEPEEGSVRGYENPQRAIAIRVLERALDTICPLSCVMARKGVPWPEDRQEAYKFLTAVGDLWFEFWCNVAGVESTKIAAEAERRVSLLMERLGLTERPGSTS